MENQIDLKQETQKSRNFWQPVLWFVLGVLCFFLSQIMFRIPLLTQMQNSTSFTAFLMANQNWVVPVSILIIFSAGLFEEGFRFLFKNFLLKPDKSPYAQPIFFGVGHALCEALYLLLPLIPVYPLSALWPAILERVWTLFIHVGLSVIVWNGFQNGKKWLYLLIAIMVHGLVNAAIPINSLLKDPTFIWLWLAGMAIILIAYSLYSRKYYLSENTL